MSYSLFAILVGLCCYTTHLQAASTTPAKPLPQAITQNAEPVSVSTLPEDGWYSYVITKGDSLSLIFQKYDLSAATLATVLQNPIAAPLLTRIQPGQILHFLKEQQNTLLTLILVRNSRESLLVHRSGAGFTATLRTRKVTTQMASTTGVIQSSLFLDGQRVGLSDQKIMELANLFRWDIDFSLDIRPGDQFRVLYEEHLLEGQKWRNGAILAAEFIHRGQSYQAFRYQDSAGNVDYYNARGYNKKRSFIRSPLPFARVSSGFTKRRWHPVLKRWRSHKGVDYAASTGTPIKVTGKGKVQFKGWKTGYGRTIIVQHGPKYQTLYAHLSKYAPHIKVGRRVEQSEVIGYVGQSGMATGPHLHYEFRVHGVHRNPLTIQLPRTLRLTQQDLIDFKRYIQPLTVRLARLQPAAAMVAQHLD